MDFTPRQSSGTKIWRHRRAGLFASTALSAVLVAPVAARAQISPTATPQGGVVVAGSATIIQAPASTTINQSSQRAAINFQSFDVGSAASVQINQPNANSVELDRVVGGNLSQINGQINSNGQVVLINQSGVVFGKGSQVNAENIVVSTSNIATADFMNGHMVFSGPPNPGAKIINEGHITARQAGLVGLVAPQVENNGVITATLGQVVLAGAAAFTLDMYGDRLISLDVTKAVQAVDVGGKAVPALVTNSGLILADGGKITLTAQDADALVTQLINAGGTIRANSVGAHAGTISIQGVGGDISIAGNLLARSQASSQASGQVSGQASGQGAATGGNIQALTTGTVAVAPGAVIDASGDTGGGVIAAKAASVIIAPGAVLRADATVNGNGGKVLLLSKRNTNFAGTISVTGGPKGGNGGTAEISSDDLISLGGSVADTAPHGQAGEVLLDPATLVIAANGTLAAGSAGVLGDITYGADNSTVSYISPSSLDSLSGTIVLEATTLISVQDAVSITSPNTSLSLVSGGDVSIDNAIFVNGALEIDAANLLDIAGNLSATDILLNSGAAGTDIKSGMAAAGNLTLGSAGPVYESPGGFIIAANLYSQGTIAGDVSLTGDNTITTLNDFSATNLILNNAGGLTLGGSVSAGNISLSAASLTFEGNLSAKALLALTSTGTIYQGAGFITAGTLTGSADGLFALNRNANNIGTLAAVSATGDNFSLADSGLLDVIGPVSGRQISLQAGSLNLAGNISVSTKLALGSTGTITQTAGSIIAGTLASLGTIRGDARLTSSTNNIGTLSGFSAAGTLALVDSTQLYTSGIVTAPVISLTAPGITFGGTLNAPTKLALGGTGDISTSNGAVDAGSLVSIGTVGGDIDLNNATVAAIGDLSLTGAFTLANATSAQITGLIDSPGGVVFAHGGVTETGIGAIDASQLDTSGTGISGDVLLTGSNNIGAIDSRGISVSGNLALRNTASLALNGNITAANVTIAAPSLAFASGAGITANAGTPSLALASDKIALAGGNNLIADGGTIFIAPLTPGYGIDIGGTLANALDIFGPLTSALDPSAAAIIIGKGPVGAQASNIAIDHSVSFGTAGIVDLATSGLISQNAGTLIAGTLQFDSTGFTQNQNAAIYAATLSGDGGTIGGNVSLGGNNEIALLKNLGASNLILNDIAGLTTGPSVSANNISLSAASITFEGNIAAKGLLALTSTGTISQGQGIIAAKTLTGSAIGLFALDHANSIAIIGSVTASGGNLSIADTGLLTVTGPVAGSSVSLSSNTINLAGNISAPDQLALGSSGNITQTAGSLTTGELTSEGSIGGNVILTAANSIASLSAFTLGGTLDLADTGQLTITGPVNGPVISIASDTINLAGNITAPTELALGSPGNITQTAGSITTGQLTSEGSIGGNVILTTANSIASLSAFTLGGTLNLADTGQLTVTGPVNGPVISIASDTINLAGNITAPDQLALGSPGSIAQSAGSITTADLTSQGSIGGNVILTAANSIASLSDFTLGGTLNLANTGLLTITGPVNGPVISLSSDTINLAGNITASDQLALGSSGNITQTAGSLTTADLTSQGSIGGNVILTAANSIASLSAFTLGGTLDLANTGQLTVTGPVNGPVISLSSDTINLAGNIIAPDQLALGSSGNITQTAGSITTGQLTSEGSIGGNVILTAANAIASLSAFTLGGTLILADTDLLTITGPVNGPVISLASDTINLAGNISAPDQLALGSSGNITQTAGSITTGELTSEATIGGNVILTAANSIASLSAFTLGGTLDLANTGQLTVTGPVNGPVISIASDTINLAGNITAPTELALGSPGNITQSAGSITTGQLTSEGTIGGNVILTAANAIASLSAFILDGTLNLADTGQLTVTGPVNGPVISIASDAINLAGNITAPDQLALGSPGNITQTAGSLTTADLTSEGSIGGNVALNQPGNHIPTLGNFTASGDMSLNDNTALDLAGNVSAAAVSLVSTGALTQTGILSTSVLNADAAAIVLPDANTIGTLGTIATGQLEINGVNAIAGPFVASTATLTSEAAFSITGNASVTNQLTILAAGGISQSGGDVIANTATFTMPGDFTQNAGTISAQIITIIAASDGFAGTILAPVKLALGSTGSIMQTAGSISAGLLTSEGTIGGNVILTAANAIASLSAFTLDGTLNLADIGQLTITGPVNGPVISLSSDTINLAGNITAPDQLALGSSGNIAQSTGSLTTADLTSEGSIGGNVILTAANAIASLSAFTLGGTLNLADTGLLTVTGPVSGPVISIASDTINLAGNITAPDQLALGSPGSITQTAGSITTGELTSEATIGGNVILTAANSIASLSAFTLGGTLDLANTGQLTVTGPVNGPVISLSSDTINLAGNITAPQQLSLNSTGDISQSAGDIITPALFVAAGHNVTQTGGSIATRNATLAGNNFTLSGTSHITDTLQINATGSIVHDAGILTATTFTGSAPQLASFAADTDFATLGSFIMQDSFFALANSGPLIIIGPVVASSLDISAAGQITLQGTPNGGLFIKGSIAPDKQPSPRPGDSSITSTPGANSPAAIIQTGNFQINAGTPASLYTGTQSQPATIFFTTSPSGTIQFAPFPNELDAPSVDIVVSSGPNGSIAGNINVKHLEIQTAQSVNLTGSINNVVGSAAAGNGSVYPSPKPQFQFNSCPIGSVNCTILPIDALPENNPLDNFDIKTRKRKKLDRNVQLPGVATRDF